MQICAMCRVSDRERILEDRWTLRDYMKHDEVSNYAKNLNCTKAKTNNRLGADKET